MNKKAAVIAAALVIAVIAAIAILTNVNTQMWNNTAQSAQLSKEDKETIDRINNEADELEALQSEAEAKTQEIEKAFGDAEKHMAEFNARAESGRPNEGFVYLISDETGMDVSDVVALIGEDGKFSEEAKDALTMLKAQKLLEANQALYDAAKEHVGSDK